MRTCDIAEGACLEIVASTARGTQMMSSPTNRIPRTSYLTVTVSAPLSARVCNT